MTRIATAILAAVSFAACQGTCESPLVLEGDLWVVDSGQDTVALSQQETLREGIPSIEFLSDGQLQGFTCCNSFWGSYRTRDSDSVCRIDMTIEGMTLALCPHSDAEHAYIEKLKQVRSYAVRHNRLLLMDSTGSVTLRLIPASTTQKQQ
ncbi:META domain-containing protein [uncultured Rikenella sp.]|uniref:META domain-containing protein n=1 Tax=uncultured Rikenella sp. TaxID=368003 RepID=UPI0026151178|nr:META domain-containing protein [uncultured Rikenella sp.]